jgi:[protein-PII] uridylyltransferase
MFRRSQPPAASESTSAEPIASSDVQAVMRRIMPDLYFINTPTSQMQRHLDLLRRIEEEPITLGLHRVEGSPLTELTMCAYDDTEPGLLAQVCGALAVHRVNIHTAYIFTACSDALDTALDRPPTPSRNIVLDTLFISEPYAGRERALTNGTIARVRNDLMRVLNHEVTVNQLLTKKARRPYPAVQTYDIAVLEDATGNSTLIKVRTDATPGILYRMTSALAALELNISVAQINTEHGQTKDIFYVTDRFGKPLSGADSLAIAQRFSAQLNDSPV